MSFVFIGLGRLTKYSTVKRLIHDESGATATEYALLAGLIAAVIVAIVAALGGEILEIFTDVEDDLDNRVAAPPAD